MKNTVRIILSGIIIAGLSLSVLSRGEDRQNIYPDVASFKAGLYVAVTEQRNIDINNDGKIDVLIFSYGGEETFLDLLIKEQNHFVRVAIPVGESYEILGAPKHYELKIGFGTFPKFGDIHLPEKYYWYDFYEVVGVTLTNRNSKHRDFFKDMKQHYEKRIKELEEEIKTLEKRKSEKGSDAGELDWFAQQRRDHIERYREFIKKALMIIQGKNGT